MMLCNMDWKGGFCLIMENYFRRCLDSFVPPDPRQWNYTSGCVMLGAQAMYRATGDGGWLSVTRRFAAEYVDETGMIRGYNPAEHNLDLMCSARSFFFLLDSTGEPRFRQGLDRVYHDLLLQPRTEEGSFWHKLRYPGQVWLDGLYMAQPLYVEYEARYCGSRNLADTISQFRTVRRRLYDAPTGLYRHGYDETRSMYWADPETGLSPSFWLRAIGWYLMALADCWEAVPAAFGRERDELAGLLREALDGLLRWQDPKSRMFYQVVDQPELPGNYLETSGSAMAAYAALKGCRLGMLDPGRYRRMGREIVEGIAAHSLVMRDGALHLTGICASAGLGTLDGRVRDGSPSYYAGERKADDDPHGTAAAMMAYAEYLQAQV